MIRNINTKHIRRKMRNPSPASAVLFIIIMASAALGFASDNSEDTYQKAVKPNSPLVTMPCMDDNLVILTRFHELSVFGSTIGNRDDTTDTYRVFPFHLNHPATVSINLKDTTGEVQGNIVPSATLPSGSYYFVVSFQDIIRIMPDTKQFSIQLRATTDHSSGDYNQTQDIETDGILLEKHSGGVLGRIIVHDVLIHRGRLALNRSDLELKGRGPSIDVTRSYSNQSFDRRLYPTLGQGWSHNHDRALHVVAWGKIETPFNLPEWVISAKQRFMPLSSLPSENDTPRYVFVNGTHFKRINNRWVASCTRHGSLVERDNGLCFISKDGTQYLYAKPPARDLAATLKTVLEHNAQKEHQTAFRGLLPNLRYTLPNTWRLEFIQDRNGNRLTPDYMETPVGPVVKSVNDSVGRTLSFQYEPELSQHATTESEYSRNPIRLKSIQGPDSIQVNFRYYPDTRLLKKVERNVLNETYSYSPSDQKSEVALPALFRHYNLDSTKDANGNTTKYLYCSPSDIPPSVRKQITALNSDQAVKEVIYPDNSRSVFSYDDQPFSQRTITDLNGNPTTYVLNEYGNPVKQIEPLGKITEYTWQLDNSRNDILMTSLTDSLGNITFYEYDLKGNITREKNSDNNITVSTWLQEFSVLQTRALNNRITVRNIYDDLGNCIESIDGNGQKTIYKYNPFGEMIQKTDQKDQLTTFQYDPRGNLQKTTYHNGNSVVYKHDIRGRLTRVLFSDGKEKKYHYDTLDRKTFSREPGQEDIRTVYDPAGNAVKETYGISPPLFYKYDSRDRVIRVSSGGAYRKYTYDNNSNLLSEKESSGKHVTYTYNALDEKITADAAARDLNLRYKSIYNNLVNGISQPAELASASWDQRQKGMKAEFLNRKGIFFFQRDNNHLALKYFTQAISLSNHSDAFLINAMNTYHKLDLDSEALEFLERYIEPHRQNTALRSWHAWFLFNNGKPTDAVSVYEKLFDDGYRDEEDFQFYTDLLDELQRYEDLDAAFTRYLKGGRSEIILMDQAKSLYRQNRHTEAINILEELQKSKAFDPDIAKEMIRNYKKLSQYDRVRHICLQLLAAGFQSTDTYYLKGDAEYRLEWLPEAKKSLEQALAFSPDNDDIKSYVDHISGRLGQGDNSSVKHPIDPVKIPDSLTALRNKTQYDINHIESDAFYRYRLKCYRYQPGRPLTYTLYRDLHITNASGVSRFSTLKYQFNPLHEQIYVNTFLVKNKEGKVIASGNPDDYYVMDTHPDDMATYDQTLFLPVPSLAPDTSIELAVTFRTKGPCNTFPFKRETFFSSYPIHLSALFIEGDINSVIHRSFNNVPRMNADKGSLWTVTNQPAYKWEPEQVDYEHFMPVVYLSAANRNWNELGKHYYQTIESRLTLDNNTRKLAVSLTQSADSRDAKIQALTSYVQKEITYKPIEFGTRGTIPNTAATTLEKKYGDCKDNAVLLQQLLAAVNIPSTLTLVDTKWIVSSELPSLDQFNHMIISIGTGNTIRYIDPTEKGLDPDISVPMSLAGKQALILDPDHIRLKTIPQFNPENCKISSDRKISVKKSDLMITEALTFQGYLAANMRSSLKSIKTSDRQQWARDIIARHSPEAVVQSVSVENLYDNRNDLIVEIQYQLEDICESFGNQLLIKIPGAWEDYYLKARPLKERRSDFEIYYPLVFDSRIEFTIPPDFTASVSHPEASNKTTAYCSWNTEHSTQKDILMTQASVRLNTGIFPSSDYSDYQQAMDRAVKSFNRKIVLQKAGGY